MGLKDWWSRRRIPPLTVVGDVGTGPPVLLVHGIASSSVTWEFLVPLLAGHRVITVDLLGFGSSPAPPDATFTIEEHERALEATVRSLRLREPFVLVGHSMGALIASRYAARRPKRLKKLVLVAPPVYLPPGAIGDPIDRLTMGFYLKAYEFLRENKEFTMRAAAGLERLAPIRGVLDVSEANWDAFVASLQNIVENQTLISDLANVTVPVEVVYGSLDPFLTPAGMRILERLRGVNVHRVEANDHVVRPRLARVVATAIDSDYGTDAAATA